MLVVGEDDGVGPAWTRQRRAGNGGDDLTWIADESLRQHAAEPGDERRAHGERYLFGEFACADYLLWLWQVKFSAAKNVAWVVDKMLHATGGTGFKKELGLERYLRDGKAGWVMGPTNEVLRQFIGKTALLGMESLDYWNQVINERALHNELKKLSPEEKRALAERLVAEAEQAEKAPPMSPPSAVPSKETAGVATT